MIPASGASQQPTRFYSLDVTRGIAAMAVVLHHWYIPFAAASPAHHEATRFPFYSILAPIYIQGWRAVDLFFCLSGFIFYWLYSERIANGRVCATHFAVMRLSRLYPLHLATLLLIAILIPLFGAQPGKLFHPPHNDLYHFFLNLFFASSWGLERGASFNGPVWSVSVEVLLYAVFFCMCFFGFRRWWQLATLALIGFALEFTLPYAAVGRGLFCFFGGGILYLIYREIIRRGIRISTTTLIAATLCTWAAAAINLRYGLMESLAGSIFGPAPMLRGHSAAHLLSHFAFQMLPFQLLPIPVTILSLALLETRRGTLGKRLAILGDVSYSSYLLHQPLQVAMAGVLLSCGLSLDVLYSPVALFAFFGTLFALSVASYRGFERPMQALLRARFLPPPLRRDTFTSTTNSPEPSNQS